MFKYINIECDKITTWESFHDYFATKFGFPDFYGRNMNAWVDCMTSCDSPEDGLASIDLQLGEILVLQLKMVDLLIQKNQEIFEALIDSISFVNFRRIEVGEKPVLMLSYFANPN